MTPPHFDMLCTRLQSYESLRDNKQLSVRILATEKYIHMKTKHLGHRHFFLNLDCTELFFGDPYTISCSLWL